MNLRIKAAGRLARRHWVLLALLSGLGVPAMTTHVLERMFVYFPVKELEADPSSFGLEYRDLTLAAGDGVQLHGWFIPKPGARHTLLILHGNAGNISHRLGWIHLLHELDAHVLIFDYRGYGRSEGKPYERGLYLDARAAYEWWRRERAAAGEKLVLVGESIGGAVAVDLASNVPVDGIVLQGTFTTGWDMAKTVMPLGLLQPLTGARFDSASKIRRISCPTLFIHGDRDEVVPLRLGRKLYELAPPPKDFFEVAGAGHNDLIAAAGVEYLYRLRSFLASI